MIEIIVEIIIHYNKIIMVKNRHFNSIGFNFVMVVITPLFSFKLNNIIIKEIINYIDNFHVVNNKSFNIIYCPT